MSGLYYMPWVFGATRANLLPYVLVFLWFMGAWILVVAYLVKAGRLTKTNTTLKHRYFVALGMFFFSHVIVWIGFFNGYIVTV